MKTTKLNFMLAAAIAVLSSCKKEALITPVQSNMPTSGTDYISFKIDGQSYSIDESSYVGNSGSTNGMDSVYYSQAGSYKYNSSNVFYSGDASNSITMTTVVVESFAPVTNGSSYVQVVSASNSNLFSMLVSLRSGNIYSAIGNSSPGQLTITRFEMHSGGKVEGTFNCNNFGLYDNSGNKLSDNHNLTNGKFSVTIN